MIRQTSGTVADWLKVRESKVCTFYVTTVDVLGVSNRLCTSAYSHIYYSPLVSFHFFDPGQIFFLPIYSFAYETVLIDYYLGWFLLTLIEMYVSRISFVRASFFE